MTRFIVAEWIEDIGDGEGPWIPEVEDIPRFEANRHEIDEHWVRFYQNHELVWAAPTKHVRCILAEGKTTTERIEKQKIKKRIKRELKRLAKEGIDGSEDKG